MQTFLASMSVVTDRSAVTYQSAALSPSTDSAQRTASDSRSTASDSKRASSKRTTSAPTTTTPPSPPHKHEYERTMTQGRVSDADIELLKDAIREARGWRGSPPRRRRASRCCLSTADPPRIAPKTNETARIRLEWRAYRLYQRCGALLEPPRAEPDDADEEAQSTRPPAKLLTAMLRQAKHLTPEQIEDELNRRDLLRLRELAVTAKAARAFRPNNCSTYRYKLARGEPIISSQFRETYNDFLRPPFANAARRLNLRYTIGARHRPAIDKRTHIWLWPVDDDYDVPLHWLRKEAPPQRADDRRSARQKSRPPLRKRAKADRTKARKARGERRPTKTPWNYGVPNTSLLVSAHAALESSGADERQSADHGDQ